MKDYLGNEISVGDVVVFSERGSRGYLGSLSNGKVSAYKEKREEISIVDNEGYVMILSIILDTFFSNKFQAASFSDS